MAVVHERLEEAELLKYAGQFDGAICGDDRYTARVIEACLPRLKVISKWGTGIEFNRRSRLRPPGRETLSDHQRLHTAGGRHGHGLYPGLRPPPTLDGQGRQGRRWQKIPGRALSECTLGVIGVGNIGKALVRRARAFGMNVLGNDIVEIDHVFLAETGLRMLDLDSLLEQSDFVSLNCDLNPTSLHLINARTLRRMRPAAVLINTARGPIVDETALVAALQAGTIAGAALDVFEVEPLPGNSPLVQMDNVMLAPHNSNSSPSAWERVHWNTIRNLLEGLGLEFVAPHDAEKA